MNRKNRYDKWGKIRENGKKHYILYYGVLGWGLPAGILSFFLGAFFDHRWDVANYFTGDWIISLFIGLLSFLLGGFIFGYLMWGTNENNYLDKCSNE